MRVSGGHLDLSRPVRLEYPDMADVYMRWGKDCRERKRLEIRRHRPSEPAEKSQIKGR
jgi:hypothetical protein